MDLLNLEFFEEEHPARKIRKLHKQGLKVIASHHDFYETPDREVMKMLLEQMGMISRLCGESFGSAITFAAHKKASAPGQMEMHEVADILERIHKIM